MHQYYTSLGSLLHYLRIQILICIFFEIGKVNCINGSQNRPVSSASNMGSGMHDKINLNEIHEEGMEG